MKSIPCATPMALLNLVYRDQLFPRRDYALAFDALRRRGREASLPNNGRPSGGRA
jgi:hypothetical protein